MSALPYITAPGGIEKALNGIKSAATPDSVSQDFVKTILGVKGGSGNQVTAYLKKIGFAASDGKPTEIYTKFRNPQSSGVAIAKALRHGYGSLYSRNEFMHKLDDKALRGLIVEETGAGDESGVPPLVLACIKALKKFADFDSQTIARDADEKSVTNTATIETKDNAPSDAPHGPPGVGLNLSYTINLNLPATSDIAVFNSIFKSLKENLLRSSNE